MRNSAVASSVVVVEKVEDNNRGFVASGIQVQNTNLVCLQDVISLVKKRILKKLQMAKKDVAEGKDIGAPFQGNAECPLVGLLRIDKPVLPQEPRLLEASIHLCAKKHFLEKRVPSGLAYSFEDRSMLAAEGEQMGRQEVYLMRDCGCSRLLMPHGIEIDVAEPVQLSFQPY